MYIEIRSFFCICLFCKTRYFTLGGDARPVRKYKGIPWRGRRLMICNFKEERYFILWFLIVEFKNHRTYDATMILNVITRILFYDRYQRERILNECNNVQRKLVNIFKGICMITIVL